MRRRLFRKPKAGDEPLFHDVEVFSEVLPLEADLHYLGQIADARARARPKVKKSKNADETPVSPVAAKRSRRLTIDSDNEEEVEESDEAPRRQAATSGHVAHVAHVARHALCPIGFIGGLLLRRRRQRRRRRLVRCVWGGGPLDEVAGRGFLIRWAGYGPSTTRGSRRARGAGDGRSLSL